MPAAVASGTIVNAGGDYVDPGGISDNATVNGPGTQLIYGTAVGTTDVNGAWTSSRQAAWRAARC